MQRRHRIGGLGRALGALAAAASVAATAPAATATTAAARHGDVAVTIYSSAQPGAIAPELYRPVAGAGLPAPGGVPGYAMVRHERPLRIAKDGEATVRHRVRYSW